MLCYLAGAIDHVTEDDAVGWRETAAHRLKLGGIGSFSPVHAFVLPPLPGVELSEAVRAINDRAIQESDVVLANLEGRSFGTPIECELAFNKRIPVYAFGISDGSIYRHLFAGVGRDLSETLNLLLTEHQGVHRASAGTGATMVNPS